MSRFMRKLDKVFGTSDINDLEIICAMTTLQDGTPAVYKAYVRRTPRARLCYRVETNGTLHKHSHDAAEREYSKRRGHIHCNATEMLQLKLCPFKEDLAPLAEWLKAKLARR